MCTVIALIVNRLPKIVAAIRRNRLRGLLRIISRYAEIVIKQSRGEFISDDRFDGRCPDVNFPPVAARRVDDRVGCDLRLEDWRDGLGFAGEPALYPTELRRVKRRHLHHDHAHLALVVQQFTPQRIAKALDGMLRTAIGRLQWDPAVGECGSHLHDHPAIARQHSFERGERAVNKPEIRDLRDTFEFLRRHFLDRRKDGAHRVVDPDVDRSELRFHRGSRGFDRFSI